MQVEIYAKGTASARRRAIAERQAALLEPIDPQQRSMQLQVFDLADERMADEFCPAFEALRYDSLLQGLGAAGRKVVVWHNAEAALKLKNQGRIFCIRALELAGEHTTLLMDGGPKLGEKKQWTNLLPAKVYAAAKVVALSGSGDIKGFDLAVALAEERGISDRMEKESYWELLRLVGSGESDLACAVDTLATSAAEGPIAPDRVRQLVEPRKSEPRDLVRWLLYGDARRAFLALHALIATGETKSGGSLLHKLTWEIQTAAVISCAPGDPTAQQGVLGVEPNKAWAFDKAQTAYRQVDPQRVLLLWDGLVSWADALRRGKAGPADREVQKLIAQLTT